MLLKPCLKDFEHYLASMWNELSCTVVWTFFSIALLWDWNENSPFPVLWPLLSFPNLLAYGVEHLTASSFRIWNSSTEIPSPPIALFIVMLPKAHLLCIPGCLVLDEWSHCCGTHAHGLCFTMRYMSTCVVKTCCLVSSLLLSSKARWNQNLLSSTSGGYLDNRIQMVYN